RTVLLPGVLQQFLGYCGGILPTKSPVALDFRREWLVQHLLRSLRDFPYPIAVDRSLESVIHRDRKSLGQKMDSILTRTCLRFHEHGNHSHESSCRLLVTLPEYRNWFLLLRF